MNALDELVRSEAASFALETVRLAGLVAVAPLTWSAAPARAKASLVLLLAVAAHGQGGVDPEIAGSPSRIALSAGSEFMLGAAIGFIVRLVVASVELAAEQVALMMGLGIAQVFDPQQHSPQNVLSGLLRNFALLVALGVGLHRLVIGATVASFRAVPVGSVVDLGAYGQTFTTLGGEVLVTGVRLAMPIIAVLLMTQIALAFVSRAAPAMQIFSVGFAVTLAVGAFVVFYTLPDLGHEVAAEFSHVEDRIASLLSNLPVVP